MASRSCLHARSRVSGRLTVGYMVGGCCRGRAGRVDMGMVAVAGSPVVIDSRRIVATTACWVGSNTYARAYETMAEAITAWHHASRVCAVWLLTSIAE